MSADPLAGTDYRVIRRLGFGGSGEVFLVEHIGLGRKFVAKILRRKHSGDDEQITRLRREAQTLARLDHPNIVAVSDFGFTADGRPFFIMPYLDGTTLADELGIRSRFPYSEWLTYANHMLRALSAAHAAGVVHRDIKPQNLFLHKRAGRHPVLKVFDFGAARDFETLVAEVQSAITRTGTVIGTGWYMSPEAVLEPRKVDHRHDIYSAAVVLSYMLTGHLPFERPPHEMNAAITGREIGIHSDIVDHEIGRGLEAVLLKALAMDRTLRYQSAEEFLAALPS